MNPSSFETNKYSIRSLVVDLWLISQSTENNQSVIGWKIKGNSTIGNWYTTKNIHLYLDGNLVYTIGTGSINLDENTEVASGEITVTHDTAGNKSIAVLLEGTIYNYSTYQRVSGTSYVTSIPRASVVTATDSNIESSSSININRYVSTYTHTLYYKFTGQADYTLIAENVGTNYGWVVPSSAYTLIPNAKTIVCSIKCETYSGTTLIGSSTATMTAAVNSSTCSPIIDSVLIEDTNAVSQVVLENPLRCLQYISNLNVEISASPVNGSTISSYKVTCADGKTANTRISTFNSAERSMFTIEVTDSRGLKTTEIHSIDLFEYTKLTLNASLYRTSPTNNEVAIKFNGNFSAMAGIYNNELTIKYRYKENGAETWSEYATLTPTITDNTYTGEETLADVFDYEKAYNFEIVANDLIYTAEEIKVTQNVLKGKPIYWWDEDAFTLEAQGYQGINKLLNESDISGIKDTLIAEYTQVGSATDFTISDLDFDSNPSGWLIEFTGDSSGIGIIEMRINGSFGLCDGMMTEAVKTGDSSGDATLQQYYYKSGVIHLARFNSSSGGYARALITISKASGYHYFHSTSLSKGTDIVSRNMNGWINTYDNITSLKIKAENGNLSNCVVKIFKI